MHENDIKQNVTEFLHSGAYARGDRLLQIKVEGKMEKPRFLQGSLHSILQTTVFAGVHDGGLTSVLVKD